MDAMLRAGGGKRWTVGKMEKENIVVRFSQKKEEG